MSTSETITYREAITRGMRDALRRDESVVLLGEDIGVAGGAFKVTEGLYEEFGPNRVMDTPISETGFIGASVGLALTGFKPVAELMFADFAGVAWDQIVNEAAKYLYLSAGQMTVPMVIRCTGGGGLNFGSQHSQTTESWYQNIPGLKVVAPSTPQDAHGLMLSAVADPNPVVYIDHKGLFSTKGTLDASQSPTPIGRAAIVRSGSDVTVVASLAMVSVAFQAAEAMQEQGIDMEVIDLRTLVPLDLDTIVESVRRTSRLVTVEEEPVSGGWGGNIVAEVVARAFDHLDAPPRRVGTPFAPLAFSPVLERAAIPSGEDVVRTVRELMDR